VPLFCQGLLLLPAAKLTLPAPPLLTPTARCWCAGTGKLDVVAGSNADVIGLDWSTSMRVCRQTLGAQHKVQGNVDPMVLFGTQVRRTHDGLTSSVCYCSTCL
jgi:hypothetical protein